MPTERRPTAAEIAERQMPGWKAVTSSGPIRRAASRDRG
jgi:hypothetical protein